MNISHIALWSEDIEELKDFYVKYFGGTANRKYINAAKGFESYFISFENGCRLELMKGRGINSRPQSPAPGYCHIAFKTNSQEEVIKLTKKLSGDGYKTVSAPRLTGDGYFESVICDPQGNLIEITA